MTRVSIVIVLALMFRTACADDFYTPTGAVQFCQKVAGGLAKNANAGACPAAEGPMPCSKLSDDFCRELWSPANRGNLALPNGGQILSGTSDKSLISHALRLDLEALLAAEPDLPADYRTKASPALAELREQLAHPSTSMRWLRRLSEIMLAIKDAAADTVSDRVEAAHPELKAVRGDERTPTQDMIYKDASLKLDDELLHAKYEKSPNWQRVVSLFATVKADLLDAIGRFHVSGAEKARMLEKVKAIELVMPSPDPRVYGNGDDCAHSDVNAAYDPRLNVFSICAGYFNTMQDPNGMYMVMAHELSHSIDPPGSAFDAFLKTPAGEVVDKLCHAQGPVYDCADWTRIRKDTLGHLKTIAEPETPLKRLSACLHTMSGLHPWDNKLLHFTGFQGANDRLDQFASKNAFTFLSQPTTLDKKGESKPNVFYMRPDLIKTKLNDDVPVNGRCQDLGGLELFVQDVACLTKDGKTIDFAKLGEADRDAIFKQGLADVQDTEAALNEHWYAVCGKDCPELQQSRMGRNAQEDFADWLGHKAFERFVARQPSTSEKRLTVATGAAFFCSPPSALERAPDLTRIEKQYSYEPHPDDRVRRMSFFTPEIIRETGCSADADTKEGTGSCDL